MDAAFEEAGFSLGVTFNVWLQKVLSGPGVAQYPELYQFGTHFGFVDIMTYMTKLGPEHRSAIFQTRVLSPETESLTKAAMDHNRARMEPPPPIMDEAANAILDDYEM